MKKRQKRPNSLRQSRFPTWYFLPLVIVGCAIFIYSVFVQRQSATINYIGSESVKQTNQSLHLPASWDWGSYITAGSSDNLNINLKKGFVIEAWVRPAQAISATSNPTIVSKRDGQLISYSLAVTGSLSGGEYLQTYDFMVGSGDCHTPNHVLFVKNYGQNGKDQLIQWHHVAGVVSSRGVMSLYVDGKKSPETIQLNSVCNTTIPVRLGAVVYNSNYTSSYYDGDLDEIHIANYPKYTRDFKPALLTTLHLQSQLLYRFDGNLSDLSKGQHFGIPTGGFSFSTGAGLPDPSPVPAGCSWVSTQCLIAPCPTILQCSSPTPTPY